MAHMDPIDLAAIDSVGDPVQRIADDPVVFTPAACSVSTNTSATRSLIGKPHVSLDCGRGLPKHEETAI
jgi:hypothetical protein